MKEKKKDGRLAVLERNRIEGKLGRKKGGKNKSTLFKAQTLEEVQEAIKKMAGKLIAGQAIAATGTHQMATMEWDGDKMNYVRVTDVDRMNELLANGECGKDYVVFSSMDPDWRAADALMNRAFGKPIESVELSGRDGAPLLIKLNE